MQQNHACYPRVFSGAVRPVADSEMAGERRQGVRRELRPSLACHRAGVDPLLIREHGAVGPAARGKDLSAIKNGMAGDDPTVKHTRDLRVSLGPHRSMLDMIWIDAMEPGVVRGKADLWPDQRGPN